MAQLPYPKHVQDAIDHARYWWFQSLGVPLLAWEAKRYRKLRAEVAQLLDVEEDQAHAIITAYRGE